MTIIKILFLIAVFGHLLCGYCDCLLIYTPSGRFSVSHMSDNEKMRKVFCAMPLKNPLRSMLFGCCALLMSSGGYFAICLWMNRFSGTAAVVMLVAMAFFYIPGTAHHVFCGAAEWFYIRMGMTEDAREAITEFLKKTSVIMIVAYLGLIVFSGALFIAVVSNGTSLPRWACVFNIILISSVLFPLRVAGAGNWAGAVMFLGLLLLV